jgi:hypothetical protein
MIEKSFEAINRDSTLKGVIENEWWGPSISLETRQKVDDGSESYNLYIMDIQTGVGLRDWSMSSYSDCIRRAEEDYGFNPLSWKEGPPRHEWPEAPVELSHKEHQRLSHRLDEKTASYRKEFLKRQSP